VPETVAALNVLIFLLPGFISQKMTEWLTAFGKSGDTQMIRDALIFSLLNYLIYAALALASHTIILVASPFPPLPAIPLVISGKGALIMHAQQVEAMAMLVIISILTGAAVSKAMESGWLFLIFRKLRLTNKQSNVDVWYDVFHEFPGRWLRVCFKDGHKVTGWPYFFSDPGKREVFLADALIEQPNGDFGELEGPGVLIPNMGEVLRIEVIDGGREEDNNRGARGKAVNAKTKT